MKIQKLILQPATFKFPKAERQKIIIIKPLIEWCNRGGRPDPVASSRSNWGSRILLQKGGYIQYPNSTGYIGREIKEINNVIFWQILARSKRIQKIPKYSIFDARSTRGKPPVRNYQSPLRKGGGKRSARHKDLHRDKYKINRRNNSYSLTYLKNWAISFGISPGVSFMKRAPFGPLRENTRSAPCESTVPQTRRGHRGANI